MLAGFLHDAVLLWAYGVNATLEEGNEPDDGLAVTNSIFNLTYYDGITGDVSIDYKGDRKFDQMLSIIQPGQVRLSTDKQSSFLTQNNDCRMTHEVTIYGLHKGKKLSWAKDILDISRENIVFAVLCPVK